MTNAVALLVPVGPKHAERIWAEPAEGGRFRLRSIPFLAEGMSWGDLVEVEAGRVSRVVERGGHSTYRLTLTGPASDEEFALLWAPLAALGCVCESSQGGRFAIDVPPDSNASLVRAALEAGATAGDWTITPADVR